MNYIHYTLQRMGKWGIILSYLASLVFIALLYSGVTADELLEPFERTLTSVVLLVFLTYQLFIQLRSLGNLDESLFFSYPLTTLEEIKRNAETKGINALYIGKVAQMKRFVDWNVISKHLKSAVNLKQSYDPNVERKENTSVPSFLPADNVLGVKYADDLYQFVQLRTASNDLHLAIRLIDKYRDKGTRVDGNYEKLKDTPEQFTPKRWLKMILVIFVVTFTFMLVSVYIAGTYL